MSSKANEIVATLVQLGLLRAAGDGGVELTSPILAADGSIAVNVNLRTGTLATLLTLAGGAGEIAVATDVEAFVKYTGVAGGAKAFRRSKFVGRTQLVAAEAAAPAASGLWGTVDFGTGTTPVDDLSAASVSTDAIVVPAGVDYYDVSIRIPVQELTGATNSNRKARLILDGVTAGAAGNQYAAAGFSDITLTEAFSGMIYAEFKHITKTKANAVSLTLQFLHNSAVAPFLGVGQNLVQFTVDMYNNS